MKLNKKNIRQKKLGVQADFIGSPETKNWHTHPQTYEFQGLEKTDSAAFI